MIYRERKNEMQYKLGDLMDLEYVMRDTIFSDEMDQCCCPIRWTSFRGHILCISWLHIATGVFSVNASHQLHAM